MPMTKARKSRTKMFSKANGAMIGMMLKRIKDKTIMTNGQIANSDLIERDLPSANARWDDIQEFALSFNGYKYSNKCGEFANKAVAAFREDKSLPRSLSDLRACLFFEQRRWRHFDEEPDIETMVYIHALIEAIREKVKNKELH